MRKPIRRKAHVRPSLFPSFSGTEGVPHALLSRFLKWVNSSRQIHNRHAPYNDHTTRQRYNAETSFTKLSRCTNQKWQNQDTFKLSAKTTNPMQKKKPHKGYTHVNEGQTKLNKTQTPLTRHTPWTTFMQAWGWDTLITEGQLKACKGSAQQNAMQDKLPM